MPVDTLKECLKDNPKYNKIVKDQFDKDFIHEMINVANDIDPQIGKDSIVQNHPNPVPPKASAKDKDQSAFERKAKMYQNVENIIPENIPEEISAGTLPINPNDYHRNELCIKDFSKKKLT